MGVEETLQNQDGSDLIDDLPVAGKGAAGGVKMAVGLGGSQPLVPKVDGEGERLPERCGKVLGSGGLRAHVAGHIKGMAEDDGRALVFAQEAAEGLEVLFRILALEGEDGLGGQAELVGDSDPDAAAAVVEAEEAGGHRNDRTTGYL